MLATATVLDEMFLHSTPTIPLYHEVRQPCCFVGAPAELCMFYMQAFATTLIAKLRNFTAPGAGYAIHLDRKGDASLGFEVNCCIKSYYKHVQFV